MFFNFSATIKVNLVAKITQCLLMCFHLKRKKSPILTVLTWFLILGKIQDGSQDDDHCWWRHRPPAAPPPIKYTSSCKEDQRLSTEGKIVLKYCNISMTLGGGGGGGGLSVHPTPHKPRRGYEFACTSRVKLASRFQKGSWTMNV